MFDRTNLRRTVAATAGAALFSFTCIAGAVAPARAADVAPVTVADWQKSVDHQIDRNLNFPSDVRPFDGHAIATVAVRFDDRGGFDGASVAKTSGNSRLDAEALRTARAIRYPALPISMRGSAQTVSMQIFFASPSDGNVDREQQVADRLAKAARQGVTAGETIQTASR